MAKIIFVARATWENEMSCGWISWMWQTYACWERQCSVSAPTWTTGETHMYYSHLIYVCTKVQSSIFLFKEPLLYGHYINRAKFCGLLMAGLMQFSCAQRKSSELLQQETKLWPPAHWSSTLLLSYWLGLLGSRLFRYNQYSFKCDKHPVHCWDWNCQCVNSKCTLQKKWSSYLLQLCIRKMSTSQASLKKNCKTFW